MGFYNTGQLFLEEYYTLAVVGEAGIGTPHLDGNTRLCTATADFALKETFGTRRRSRAPTTDFDVCRHASSLVGHNMAETQTVLWMRILDRLRGPEPAAARRRRPAADRRSPREADVHLPIRAGTNVAAAERHPARADRERADRPARSSTRHTVGFEKLAETVEQYPPERVAEICGVPADDIRAAARDHRHGADAWSRPCLQGVYQSHQATAAACQVNNINLLRGMIGKPGLHRLPDERPADRRRTRARRGANGDLTGIPQLAEPRRTSRSSRGSGTSTRRTIPHWAPPTHAMQIFRYAEAGLDPLPLDHRHQPGRLAARAAPDPRDPRRRTGCSSSSATPS